MLKYSLKKIWFTMCVLWVFVYILPQSYLDYFVQGHIHLPTTQNFLWRQGIKREVLLYFENFQIVVHGFLGCPFLGKYRIFHFGQVLLYQINFHGVATYVNSRHICRYPFRIYIALYGYKASYIGLKIRKNVKFWQFLRFSHF